ncbi:hypothetical protein EV2_034832 [Malus domestica]
MSEGSCQHNHTSSKMISDCFGFLGRFFSIEGVASPGRVLRSAPELQVFRPVTHQLVRSRPRGPEGPGKLGVLGWLKMVISPLRLGQQEQEKGIRSGLSGRMAGDNVNFRFLGGMGQIFHGHNRGDHVCLFQYLTA